MRARTNKEIAEIDAKLARDPIDPVLDLWERLRVVGGMPAMQPDHFREIGLALYEARNRQAISEAGAKREADTNPDSCLL